MFGRGASAKRFFFLDLGDEGGRTHDLHMDEAEAQQGDEWPSPKRQSVLFESAGGGDQSEARHQNDHSPNEADRTVKRSGPAAHPLESTTKELVARAHPHPVADPDKEADAGLHPDHVAQVTAWTGTPGARIGL